MITVTNRIIHPEMLREEYLKLPGTSFSGLKNINIPISFGIKIGFLVHTYILKPKEYNFEHAEIVRPIAATLVECVGQPLLQLFTVERPITANFEYNGMTFLWKGIPDLFMENVIVIDFKILATDLSGYLSRFNYEEQLRGYMKGTGCKKGLIIAYNKKRKKIEFHWVFEDDEWWEKIIINKNF